MSLRAGIQRICITPFYGVELTGWGYYLERKWRSIRDHLNATAVALDDGVRQCVVIALDLMVIDQQMAQRTRRCIHDAIGIEPSNVLLTCSHSHNAPAAGGLLGVGECDPLYEKWVSLQAATAAILAWHKREPVRLFHAECDVSGYTFNRTRNDGPVDTRLTTLRLDRSDHRPMALLLNFAAHPTVMTELFPTAVTRDVPGEVCDHLERAIPGVTAVYIQGACGDVNFRREYSCADRAHEPARRIADAALEMQPAAREAGDHTVSATASTVSIPTRRWNLDEIEGPATEARRRRENRDIHGWREGFGRALTNRPDDMVRRHDGNELKAVLSMARFYSEWSALALKDWETRAELLETEVQSVRIGEVTILANQSELFVNFANDLRRRVGNSQLMIACYSNGRIGYMPDEHDIAAKSYAAYQSPKYCNQFPFVDQSGPALVEAMYSQFLRTAK